MTQSLASYFRSLSVEERQARLALLSEAEREHLLTLWKFWARPEQLTPPGDWQTWLLLAGRGFGKTRVGAEWVREQIRAGSRYVNLIGATLDDARDIMIEGESGILAICPKAERPRYVQRQLRWPNGAVSLIFTADEPQRLRGKQHQKLWADELAAWRYAEAWDQAMFGLRLPPFPQALVSTTPRPTKIIRDLLMDPSTHVTRGTTYDNEQNLAASFFKKIIRRYEGTRLGRQELSAEILDDNPHALWKRSDIERARVLKCPSLRRIVVGLDPAVTSDETSDESGIIGVGLGHDNEFYVVRDASMQGTPLEWAKATVQVYDDLSADRVIGEANNGGDLIETVLRTVAPNVSYQKVTASRGKDIRAEPVAALYEQGRVHHVGTFSKLEDQMCEWDPVNSKKSPDRMDGLVWAITALMSNDAGGIIDFVKGQVHGQAIDEDQQRSAQRALMST